MKNILDFCEQTRFKFEIGEVGMGRPCVGIIDPETESYIDIIAYDSSYEQIGQHTIACEKSPKDAYHKHPCLAVLYHGDDSTDAIKQLDTWLKDIIESGYEIKSYIQYNGINALLGKNSEIKYISNKSESLTK